MAADLGKVNLVCPDIKHLITVETNIECPIDGCSKILPNTSCLRMHLVKTHKTIAEANESTLFERRVSQQEGKAKTQYCCPVEHCCRGKKSGRPFNRLAHVKQHYMTVHGEKKFTCSKCQKKFGRGDACLRHEKSCGLIFSCSCGSQFNTRTSVLTHAKRNGHVAPILKSVKGSGDSSVTNLKKPSVFIGQSGPVLFVPLVNVSISSAYRPLVPQNFSNVATQTDQPSCSSSVSYDVCITEEIGMERADMDAVCKHTQTVDPGYNDASLVSTEQFEMDFTIDNEELKELAHSQTQTNWDFSLDSFPLFEDNETQTLDSYLELDPGNMTIDCATQTKNILDKIFSVDTETQTLVPVIDITEEDLGSIHCSSSTDNHTQTLPRMFWSDDTMFSALQCETSNVETQTSSATPVSLPGY